MPVAIEEASVGNLPKLGNRDGLRVEPVSAIYSLHVAGHELAELRRIAKSKHLSMTEAIAHALEDYIHTDGNKPLFESLVSGGDEV